MPLLSHRNQWGDKSPSKATKCESLSWQDSRNWLVLRTLEISGWLVMRRVATRFVRTWKVQKTQMGLPIWGMDIGDPVNIGSWEKFECFLMCIDRNPFKSPLWAWGIQQLPWTHFKECWPLLCFIWKIACLFLAGFGGTGSRTWEISWFLQNEVTRGTYLIWLLFCHLLSLPFLHFPLAYEHILLKWEKCWC